MTVSYLAISPQELERIVRDATKPAEYITSQAALDRYGLTINHLKRMVRDGLIKEYRIPGIGKTTRYRAEEIEQTFKPINV